MSATTDTAGHWSALADGWHKGASGESTGRMAWGRIASGFAILLSLLVAQAAVTFRLIDPVKTSAARVGEANAAADAANTVLQLAATVNAKMAQYVGSGSEPDRILATDTLRQLDAAVTADARFADSALASAIGRYRIVLDQSFRNVEGRREAVDALIRAGTESSTTISAITLWLERETNPALIQAAAALLQRFQQSEVAATRFLVSHNPADANIALGAVANVPAAMETVRSLATGRTRVQRFVLALGSPLAAYTRALATVINADARLRETSLTRGVAREAVGTAVRAAYEKAMQAQRAAVASTLIELRSMRRLLLLASAAGVGLGLFLAVLIARVMQAQFHRLELARRELGRKSTILEVTLAHMEQGLVMVTADARIGVANVRAENLLEMPGDLLRPGAPLSAALAFQRRRGEFDEHHAALIRGLGRTENGGAAHFEHQRRNGTVLDVCVVALPDGGRVLTYSDITERRQAQEQLVHASRHDGLTGLPNRTAFADTLRDALAMARQTQTALSIMFIDLDRFKLVNDTLGHAAGDALLLQAAKRMRAAIRPCDTLARIGGDEFALVMPGMQNSGLAAAAAERLRLAVSDPYALPQGPARIGVSIGLSHYPEHGATPDELLNNADLALYRAKLQGRDTCCIFDDTLDNNRHCELALEAELRHALEQRQFTLVYQPILDVRSDRVVNAEALVRWQHPTRGLVPPSSFIPAAERSSFIVELGRWVLEAACAEALTWSGSVGVSVNVSPVQLRRPAFVRELREILAATGLPASRLKVEITESQLLEDSQEVLTVIGALHDMGVGIVLDDFGTGHASLSSLRSFPFSDVKVDRSFVAGIELDARSRELFHSILQVCNVLGLRCVAEGVETPEQLALLQSMGCTYAQGFLIGRPATPERLRSILTASAPSLLPPVAEPFDAAAG